MAVCGEITRKYYYLRSVELTTSPFLSVVTMDVLFVCKMFESVQGHADTTSKPLAVLLGACFKQGMEHSGLEVDLQQ